MALIANSSIIKTVKANNTEMYDVYANNTLVYSKRVFTIFQKWTYPNTYSTTIIINKTPLANVGLNSPDAVIMKAGIPITIFTYPIPYQGCILYYGHAMQTFSFTPSTSGPWGTTNTSTQTITLYSV